MLTLEDKMTTALTEHAKVVSASLNQLREDSAEVRTTQSFAQAVSKQSDSSAAQMVKPHRKANQINPPLLFPSISLVQKTRDKPVELDSDDGYFVECVNKKLASFTDLHSLGDNTLSIHPIRGFTKNHRTGDITLQFNCQEDTDTAALLHASWVPALNNSLRLKLPSYPIIVHGIPNKFNQDNAADIENLVSVNEGILDSLLSIKWANQHLIESGKPFSFLIIHLRDPEEANKAIKNRINFLSILKVVAKSVRRQGQCLKCLAYGHSKLRCNTESKCASCSSTHPMDVACPSARSPLCANCVAEVIKTSKVTNPSFSTNDLTDSHKLAVSHAATASTCPICRKLAAKAQSSEFFTITKKNRSTHDVR